MHGLSDIIFRLCILVVRMIRPSAYAFVILCPACFSWAFFIQQAVFLIHLDDEYHKLLEPNVDRDGGLSCPHPSLGKFWFNVLFTNSVNEFQNKILTVEASHDLYGLLQMNIDQSDEDIT